MATPSQPTVQYYPGYSQQTVTQNLVWKAIASITNSFPMVLTTTEDHKYYPGILVRFQIPNQFGMVQLNDSVAQVLQVTNNSLTINVDSSNFTPFAYPSPVPEAYTPPTVIPDASGAYLPPPPIPDPNQDSFEGVVFNNGQPLNPIDGI